MAAPAEHQATQPAPRDGMAASRPAAPTTGAQEQPELCETCAAGAVLGEAGMAGPRYATGELLGLGSTGAVFAVEDRDLVRQVALKVLRQDQALDHDRRAAFLNEARTTARLAHPNVLPVLDLRLAADGRPYFTMHRISGRTLLETIAPLQADQGASPTAVRPLVSRVLAVGIAACHALSYAHAQRIIHQDIKPENILLGDFGEVLVLDWGSAAVIPDAGTVTTGLYGTPLYMAPEQAAGSGVDTRADIYGLGATLWHALLGRPPFWRDEPEAFWQGKRAGAIDEATARERERFPPELLAILHKALAADPAARYGSIDAFRQDLEAFQAGLMVRAHHYGLLSRLRRWCRRHPTMLTAVGLVVAGAATCGALLERERQLQAHAWHLDESLSFTTREALAGAWTGSVHVGFTPSAFDPMPMTDPRVSVDDGWLTLHGVDSIINVAHTAPNLGSLRIEWTARTLVGEGNLNCFIGATNRLQGLTLHIGGWGSPAQVALTEPGIDQPIDAGALPVSIEIGHTYHFALECVDRELRLWMDGQRVFTHLDVAHDLGDSIERFGFEAYQGHVVQIRDVRVSHQLPARFTSPLAIPDELVRLEHWHDAALRYRAIAHAFPDSEIERQAQVREAFALAADGDAAGSDRLLEAFIQAHPHDPLTPQAMVRELAHAVAAHDRPRIARLRDGLAAFAGDRILMAPLARIVDEYLKEMPLPEDLLSPSTAAQALEHVRHLVAEVNSWRSRYGVEPLGTFFWQTLAGRLCHAGKAEEALRLLPAQRLRERAGALVDQGRLAEARALAPTWHYPQLLQGDVRGALAAASIDPATAERAALCLHDRGALEAMAASPEHRIGMDIQTAQDAQRMVALLPQDEEELGFGASLRVLCLIRLGRSQEILDHYHHHSALGLAYVAQGRIEEAMAIAPYDLFVRGQAAAMLVGRGQAAAAVAVMDLQRRSRGFDLSDAQGGLLMPALVDAAAGQPARARAWIALWREPQLAGGQIISYMARFILGEIDEPTYLHQPVQLGVEQGLLLAKATRAELAGDLPLARACYRTLVQVPLWQRMIPTACLGWVAMRLTQGGDPVPWNWGLCLSNVGRG